MKLSDFILLSVKEKRRTVLTSGVVIAKRTTPNAVIFLFGVQGFYVETCFNAHNKDIEEFRMFDGTRLPPIYLEALPVNGILD